uniref:NADH dehydrogenase subunit 2 n=1 Tax=Echinocrepis rostrata TaxID=527038 RepID=UPI00292A3E11|nr:NADH dehydrogenase subunit 2 [Echinocrepis rostrata]WNL54525.1 NADH dehydrogenase subunit 2 [Echinocrepis rostrata]
MYRIISIFLFITIILGTIIAITSENWFIIWIGLEISTLALVPLLCANFTPRNIEATIKYFLIQAFSAALLLNSALIQAWLIGSWSILTPTNLISSVSITIALAFKLGLAPCHFWFPDVLQGLPFINGLIVATWQKIAPLIILFSFEQLVSTYLIIILALLSVLVGGWGGLNQTQIRKILAFSSIGNIGWIVLTSTYSIKAAIAMLIIYLIINTTAFLLADFFNISTLGHLNITSQLYPISGILIVSTILSLGGLPPLTGFIVKLISLYFLISNGFIILSPILIIGSLLSLFFYIRIAFNTSLILFPHHIIGLTTWRNNFNVININIKTWFLAIFFILATITTPLTLSLYIIV